MANSENGRIGCSAGRAKIVDPNDFNGFNSTDNVPVQQEDLNISVVLKSFRKGRTLLTGENEGGKSESVSQIEVNFIEGSDVGAPGGKKVLTTKYTDLTTSFDKGTINDETLGITSIDIEFNPSMAPMITINFIDVRGSSIFQNEENILNNRGNKYTTFFQLPYPMFELEVKGYYGMPVKYCLHMLKFNSKFNSKTGNFEITCNFVGYTFALMSDMLIGYLKAIPFTKIGKEQFELYNSTISDDRKVTTLVDLSKNIRRVNEGLTKVSNESPASKDLNALTTAFEQIDAIKNQMTILGQSYDLNTNKEQYEYIIFKHKDNLGSSIDTYKEEVKKNVEEYNKATTIEPLVETDFIDITTNVNTNGGKYYTNITIKDLKTQDDSTLKLKLGNPYDFGTKKEKILSYISSYYKDIIGENEVIDIIDISLLYDKLGKSKKALENKEQSSKTELAESFAKATKDMLGFDPTSRRIIEHFTAAIEVFLETIFRVSQAASINTDRSDELSKKFINDGKNDSKDTDMKNVFIDLKQFFPWPDYREQKTVESKGTNMDSSSQNQTYVEKYLGASGVLERPEKVDELVFIEDLLQAFRKAAQADNDNEDIVASEETTWFPVNPLDSKIFIDKEPYDRVELIQKDDVIRLMVIRAMTFLGYSKDLNLLTENEIIGFATAEVDAALRSIKNDILKQSITQIDIKDIYDVKGSINGVSRPVISVDSTNKTINYNYIFKKGSSNIRIIPLNKGFGGEGDDNIWGTPDNSLTFLNSLEDKRKNEGSLFLTNYGSADILPSNNVRKIDDGGIYVRILDELPAPVSLVSSPEGVTNESVIIFDKIKEETNVDASAGFNFFGGDYGIQEFKTMNWGSDKSLEGLPLMYVFYRHNNTGLASLRNEKVGRSKFSFYVDDYVRQQTGDRDELYKNDNDEILHDNLGKNRYLLNKFIKGDNVTYPYIELPYFEDREKYKGGAFSLFGSKLYYQQVEASINLGGGKYYNPHEYCKAFLFLHSLPFNINQETLNPLGVPTIFNLFNKTSGIIHAPKIWCAYIGSILWRFSPNKPIIENGLIIGGGSGSKDPLIWKDYGTHVGKYQYFPSFGVEVLFNDDLQNYDVIRNLPNQAKDEFLQAFFNFVNGTTNGVSWKELSDKLEIFESEDSGSSEAFNKFLEFGYSKNGSTLYMEGRKGIPYVPNGNNKILSFDDLYSFQYGNYKVKKDNIKKYYNIVTLTNGSDRDTKSLFLELRDSKTDFENVAISLLIKAMTEESFIINTNYKVWDFGGYDEREEISVPKDIFDGYFKVIIDNLKSKADDYNITKKNEKLDISVFGTANKDIIKLQLYRTCKNIYDKWLGGAESIDKLVFQCGGRSSVDSALAAKYNNSKTRMIDSFRFVSRNFKDIGDSLYINPIPINNYLVDNPNTAAYDVIASILAANNFNFQALPNFINFHDEENLKAIFKPYSYYDATLSGSCGPAFVCVYAGQSSKHLDFREGNYPNDGFDLRCMNGNVDVSVPKDFTSEPYAAYEDPIGTFMVRYSQQNQNIFKDIVLDQSEFSETDESLQIQGEIAQKGSENNRAIVGQNIYNVYAVRSYTAQVEMMGNAMIQPMMYFQLDNIPMFHGAYLITNVSHSITPNHMSTNFTGTRIRYPETPLISSYDIYMSLMETLDISGAGSRQVGSSGGISGTFKPIVATIIENDVINGDLNGANNIKFKKVPDIPGITFQNSRPNERVLLDEAIKPLVKMLTDWVKWMKDNGFKAVGEGKSYAYITSMYRTLQHQQELSGKGGAAKAGRSNHGWGIAVDLQMFSKDGVLFKNDNNSGSPKSFFNFETNPAYGWLMKNSYKYGYINPYSLRDGSGIDEHWHFEYHGKSAKCLLEEHTTVFGQTVKVDGDYIKDLVKNPKTKDGKEAVYTDCKGRDISSEGDSLTETGCPATSSKKPFEKQSGFKGTIDKIINGTYSCSQGRDCKGSFDGLKQVPAFWSNNKLTKKGVVAMAFGVSEGFGSGSSCKNPGNLRGTGCNGFQKFNSWKAGWEAYNTQVLEKWSNGDVPATASAKYAECYKADTNKVLKESGVKYQELPTYNYKQGTKPTLRQFINIYAPWGDANNPSNYIASVAATLKAYGYTVDVDAPMNTWL